MVKKEKWSRDDAMAEGDATSPQSPPPLQPEEEAARKQRLGFLKRLWRAVREADSDEVVAITGESQQYSTVWVKREQRSSGQTRPKRQSSLTSAFKHNPAAQFSVRIAGPLALAMTNRISTGERRWYKEMGFNNYHAARFDETVVQYLDRIEDVFRVVRGIIASWPNVFSGDWDRIEVSIIGESQITSEIFFRTDRALEPVSEYWEQLTRQSMSIYIEMEHLKIGKYLTLKPDADFHCLEITRSIVGRYVLRTTPELDGSSLFNAIPAINIDDDEVASWKDWLGKFGWQFSVNLNTVGGGYTVASMTCRDIDDALVNFVRFAVFGLGSLRTSMHYETLTILKSNESLMEQFAELESLKNSIQARADRNYTNPTEPNSANSGNHSGDASDNGNNQTHFERDLQSMTSSLNRHDPMPNSQHVLNSLIGLAGIKRNVAELAAVQRVQSRWEAIGVNGAVDDKHLVFVGNPGTAKTTVARLVGSIYRDYDVLSRGHVIEVSASRLIGGYIGWTAKIVDAICGEAEGGVLFVDEAYSLIASDSNGRGYGREAISALLQQMENKRSDLVVILAGYRTEMKEFLAANTGFQSRVASILDFPDYTDAELELIFLKMVDDAGFVLSEPEAVLDSLTKLVATDKAQNLEHFGNGRFIRQVFEHIKKNVALRIVEDESIEANVIVPIDVPKALRNTI